MVRVGVTSGLDHLVICPLLAVASTPPLIVMPNDPFVEHVGKENLCGNLNPVLEKARQLIVPR